MVRGGVFINYRGEDSHSYGALLHAELSRRFGPELVFLDSETIPPGADFGEQLLGRVRHARVVLAVIGARWRELAGEGWPTAERRPGRLGPAGADRGVHGRGTGSPGLTDQAQIPAEARWSPILVVDQATG